MSEIGNLPFSIRILNRKTLKILATAAQKLGDGTPACMGALLLAAYRLTLYDDSYVVGRQTGAQMAEVVERTENEFEMKITPRRDRQTRSRSSRRSGTPAGRTPSA